ncbi:proline-rich receptor-like protein kinase PERK2 [Clupea harengus]|uniref:Proline-rich receptor-like protein kinase PERK2 n=1 Tax=Clupea harengus TaxID=7950 RepID=A0A6P8GEZ5_CLUHA|nr:proline-rich receptor-like protein kinase PERK2 [Clupea harengus]
MQPEHVTALGSLQIPSQPVRLHESSPQGRGQLSPPLGSSPQAPCVASVLPPTCWTLEVAAVVLLMTVAGVAILILLYMVLLLRHRLKVAQAGNTVEYWGFFRSARYSLKEPRPPQVFPVPTTVVTPGPDVTAPPVIESKPLADLPPCVSLAQHQPPPPYWEPPPSLSPTSSGQSPPNPSTQLRTSPLPPRFTKSLPPVAAPVLRTTSVPIIPFPSLPRPLHLKSQASLPLRPLSAQPHPHIYTTPPSPHLSWGACSDVDVYSRVGSMTLSRPASRSQTQVILFEHSAL